MAFWVYILKCADGKFYTGQTDDLDRRMGEHQHGGFCDFTSHRRPVELVWSEYYQTRGDVIEFEKQVQSWSRAKKIGLINGYWKMVSHFARPPHERVVQDGQQHAGPSTSLGTNGGGLGQGDKGKAKLP